ncbi:Signal transduction histidine kinase [hydrothermal vent metagenome]|uniref:Signal transduction histidine kinase n=1 Tax=hydrothermal vent metagenome TaxID=652676 RepID=A0A3B0VP65_9ZZZZ
MVSISIKQCRNKKKLLIILLMVVGISGVHLFISRDYEKSHILARELYFLPIILSAFWFGLQGAVITVLSISVFYLSFSALHWQGFRPDDLERLLEIGLFNIVAITTGYLQDKQQARTREKLGAIKALAGTVAHEMNSPLFVALGNLELLQDDFDHASEPYQELEGIKTNLKELRNMIKKISQLREIVTKDYDGTSRIVDLEKSHHKVT